MQIIKYYINIRGQRVLSTGHEIDKRNNGYSLVWDDKYGESLVKENQIIRDETILQDSIRLFR